ncbi:MAG: hypothetical protein J6Y80_00680 [Victivallales bacterium]|nr:hypothetical protein [Victivallales bacterium]
MSAACLALLLVVTAVNFCRAVNYEFLDHWDDGIFILENRHLGWTARNFRRYALKPFQDLYTPLPMYSLMADKALFGVESPLPYHLHNLLLHLGCTALFFWICLKFKLSPTWALLAALLWSVNPQKSESVAWITERKDLLCGLFAFAAFLAFQFGIESTCTWKQVTYDIICGILTILAIFAKPAAAPLAGIYVVFALAKDPLKNERAQNGAKNERAKNWSQLVPVLCGVLAAGWSAYVTSKTNPGVLSLSPAVPLHNLLWYPVTAVLPNFGVNPIYPNIVGYREYWTLYLGGVILLAVFVWYALRIRGIAWTKLLAGVLILGGTMLPVLGMWVYTNFDYCDRYNYLVSAVAVAGLALVVPENRLTRACACTLIVLMLIATQCSLGVWRSTQEFWRSLIVRDERVNPKVFEVAANDALVRDSAEDLEYVIGFIDLHRKDLESPRLSRVQIENTLLLLQGHLFLLREEYGGFLAQTLPLMAQEEASGGLPPFMRRPNYPKIYRRNAKFARLLQRIPQPPNTQP